MELKKGKKRKGKDNQKLNERKPWGQKRKDADGKEDEIKKKIVNGKRGNCI